MPLLFKNPFKNFFKKTPVKKVVVIAVDGVREKEAQPEFAPLMVKLHMEGYKVKWQSCKTDQPHQTSLPAYASLFMGAVDPEITSNTYSSELKYQTLFQIFPESQLFSAWYNLRYIMGNTRNAMITDKEHDGFGDGHVIDDFFKHRDKKSQLSFIHLMDTDELAHQGKWESYLQAVKNSVGHVGRVIKESDDNTDFIIFTDHGRGEDTLWFEHGQHFEGSDRIWTLNVSRTEPVMACGHVAIFREVIRVLKN
jgi:hypothetical protein